MISSNTVTVSSQHITSVAELEIEEYLSSLQDDQYGHSVDDSVYISDEYRNNDIDYGID